MCAIAGGVYIGVTGAVFGAGYAVSVYGQNAALLGACFGFIAGVSCGLVTGITYGASGGPLGAIVAGLCGGAANPLLRDFAATGLAGIHTLRDLYSEVMQYALPFVVCWVFAWLLYRAGEGDVALPMLAGTAQIQARSGLYRLPIPARFAAAFLLGALGAWAASAFDWSALIW